MTRMIRATSLTLVLICALFALPAFASEDVIDTDVIISEGLNPEADRGPEVTIQYGDPDDISGNRSNGVFGDALDIGNLLVGGSGDPEDLLLAWLMYLDLLSL